MAIERLVKTKVITGQDSEMTVRLDVQTEEDLERLLFPDEFVAAPTPEEEDEDDDGLVDLEEEALLEDNEDGANLKDALASKGRPKAKANSYGRAAVSKKA